MKNTIIYAAAIAFGITGCIACSNHHDADTGILQAKMDSLSEQLQTCTNLRLKEEANMKLVSDMYQQLFGDKNIEAADRYIAEDYIQHNPNVADGRAALKEALTLWFRNAKKEKIDIRHIGADDDFVYIHTRSQIGGKTSSVIDIFRIEGDKVVEHWDVIQEVPEKAANDHPMF